MTGIKNKAAAMLFLAAATVSAQYKPAVQTMGGLNLKISDDATVKVRAGLGFLNQLEQIDEYFFKYAKKGLTSKQGSAGLVVKIGKLGNLDIAGGGEILALSRTMDDTSAHHDYFELRPSGLMNFSLPFGEIFKAEHNIRFERRIFREPNAVISHFRYNSETKLSAEGILPLQSSLFLFYRGFVQNSSKSMSQWGGGLTMRPVDNLLVELGYSMLWMPENKSASISPIALGLTYTFDMSKKAD